VEVHWEDLQVLWWDKFPCHFKIQWEWGWEWISLQCNQGKDIHLASNKDRFHFNSKEIMVSNRIEIEGKDNSKILGMVKDNFSIQVRWDFSNRSNKCLIKDSLRIILTWWCKCLKLTAHHRIFLITSGLIYWNF
jgi:hypothetical protein